MANNRLVTSQLWAVIDEATRNSKSVYILASFAMESGIRIMTPTLQQQVARGAMIKILVGDYLYITEPEALRRLHALTPGVDTRLCSGNSFHPKAYLFHHPHRGIGRRRMRFSTMPWKSSWLYSLLTRHFRWMNQLSRAARLNMKNFI